jgi:purine-binding chemotaxis protein CheW
MQNKKAAGAKSEVTYFVFHILEELFAIEIDRVINVLEMSDPTPVPETPDYLEGIINVRGELLPVVNARAKFGMPQPPFSKDACILLLEIHARQEQFRLGLMVDRADDVIGIPDEKLEQIPDMGLNMNPDYVKAAFNREQDIIFVLDIDEIFSHKQVTEIKELKEQQKG